MKLTNLFWVLAVAGSVAACNSGPPIQGCIIDPATGVCMTTGGGTGGGNGGGGSGGGDTCIPGDAEFTNACTCSSTGEVDINCDYGCSALGNDFGFAAVLAVAPEDGFVGGAASDVGFDGFFVVSEAFIEGAEGVVGNLNTAEVLPGATLPPIIRLPVNPASPGSSVSSAGCGPAANSLPWSTSCWMRSRWAERAPWRRARLFSTSSHRMA